MSSPCRPHYRAVLFDFFNTLTCAVHRGSSHTLIAAILGVDPREWVALLDRTFLARARGEYGTAMEGLHRLCAELGAHPSRAQLHAAIHARIQAVREDGPLRPDAGPLLKWLRHVGVRTAVVSDCWFELPVFLPRLPIAPLLHDTIYSIEVGHTKPHPTMYLRACDRLGVEPAQCVYVGDGGSRELSGARVLGMTAIRLTAPDLGAHLTFHAERAWNGPNVESLRELTRVLEPEPVLV